jgi:hypothetical protein
MLPRHSVSRRANLAVFVHREHGDFQLALVRANSDADHTLVYEINEWQVRLAEGLNGAPLFSVSQIPAGLFIFINRPLEALNHLFFDELANTGFRIECGLVTGISLNCEKRVLHSGYIHSKDGELIDPAAGLSFLDPGLIAQLNSIASVEAISDEFFAVRRELLVSVGGLSTVSGDKMRQLVDQLVQQTHRLGMKILVTPYSVATLTGQFGKPE